MSRALCIAWTNRRRAGWKPRQCAQKAIDGTPYCYYHQPGAERRFGEGYTGRVAEQRRTQRREVGA